MSKLGFFGGTFDPPHMGHLNLAVSLKEQAGLDKVLVCPTSLSPLKAEDSLVAAGEHRLSMVRAAFDGVPGFEVVDTEIHLNEPSYTIDTITGVKKKNEGDEIFLLLGADLIPRLSEWKEYKKLLSIASPLFGGRSGAFPTIPQDVPDEIKKIIENGMYAIPQFDVSATDIRHRLAEQLYCGHLVPSKVLDYIYEHSIYLSN